MAPKNKNKNKHRDNKAEPEKKVDGEAEKATESGKPETLEGTGESTLALPPTRGTPPPRAGHDEEERTEGESLEFGAIVSFYCFSRPLKPHLHFMRLQKLRAHTQSSAKHTPQTSPPSATSRAPPSSTANASIATHQHHITAHHSHFILPP